MIARQLSSPSMPGPELNLEKPTDKCALISKGGSDSARFPLNGLLCGKDSR